jgi:hypothetical protein
MNALTFERRLASRGITLTDDVRDDVLHGEVRDLLTLGNPKTAKGQKYGYLTAILHLAPSWTSGLQTCPKATPGCSTACLFTAGRGGFDPVIPAARKRRTYWYFMRRADFMARLVREVENHCKRAAAHGLTPCVRLNGTSDIRWENVPCVRDGVEYANIMDAFSTVQFYDYTKLPNRGELPANYRLTFSAADGNEDDVNRALEAGMNVAAVFRSRAVMAASTSVRSAGIRMRKMSFPATHEGRPLIDGDKSDLRFLDSEGCIVALRAKGEAVSDTSGFVRDLP